ncbi:MAG: MoaD/ThiS family protein [Desulfitobacteriaceae bacterium]|nr:MoaD/ThiS family protein [Desulfitobacteriaceae bacterium]
MACLLVIEWEKMSAIIRPYGMLADYLKGEKEASVEAGQTVRQALSALGIPPQVVALVVVNDQPQDKDYLLQDGDLVKLLAVIGGGG